MMQHKDDDYTAAGFAGCFLLYSKLSIADTTQPQPKKILAGVILSTRNSPEQFREIAWIIVELFQYV